MSDYIGFVTVNAPASINVIEIGCVIRVVFESAATVTASVTHQTKAIPPGVLTRPD